jgi:hypothetical protein
LKKICDRITMMTNAYWIVAMILIAALVYMLHVPCGPGCACSSCMMTRMMSRKPSGCGCGGGVCGCGCGRPKGRCACGGGKCMY